MPRDISSSSEDEGDNPTTKSPVKPKETGKFTCTYCTKLVLVADMLRVRSFRLTPKGQFRSEIQCKQVIIHITVYSPCQALDSRLSTGAYVSVYNNGEQIKSGRD